VKKWDLEIADSAVLTEDQERCTRQPAQIAGLNARYLSSQPMEDLCTAKIATRNIENTERVGTFLATV